MQKAKLLTSLVLVTLSPLAFAFDAACDPIISASEKKMSQSAWHSIATLTGGRRMEFLKINGEFYSNLSGAWNKLPTNLDSAEKDMIGQMRSGTVKVTDCKQVGSEAVEGVSVLIISSKIEMQGAPAVASKLYIGKSDGLPYKQVSSGVEILYKYKGVGAPKV